MRPHELLWVQPWELLPVRSGSCCRCGRGKLLPGLPWELLPVRPRELPPVRPQELLPVRP